MTDHTEQRHFTRIPFDATVRISTPEGDQHWDSTLLDISLKGALCSRPENWSGNTGAHYNLLMLLAGDEVTLKMEASVAHIEAGHIGFACEHMDLDTATHLHRLVELNLGDEQLLKRELSELIQATGT